MPNGLYWTFYNRHRSQLCLFLVNELRDCIPDIISTTAVPYSQYVMLRTWHRVSFFVVLSAGRHCLLDLQYLLPNTRWVQSHYCSQTKQQREKILVEPEFEPMAARWEARMLPLCYAALMQFSLKTHFNLYHRRAMVKRQLI